MRITRHADKKARVYNPGFSGIRKPPAKPKRKVPQIFWLVLLLVLLSAGTVFALRLDRLQLGEVVIEGAKSEDQTRLKQVVEGELSGSYLYVIPRRNIFLYSENRITTALEAAAPRLEAISLEQAELRELVVRVVERAPVAIACTENTDGCFFVDHLGLLFARAPHVSGSLFLNIVLPPERLKVGERVMDVERFKNFLDLRGYLDSALSEMPYDYHVERLLETTVEGETRLAFEVGPTNEEAFPWKIFVPQQFDLEELPGRISPVFKELASDARKADAKSLEYVDFRFGNRVFYKYR